MTTITVADALRYGIERHRTRQLAEAEVFYRKVLEVEPRNTQALHLLGVLAYETGHGEAGVALIASAIELSPGDAELHNSLGNALCRASRFEEGAAAYQTAMSLDPQLATAPINLAIAYFQLARFHDSLKVYQGAAASPSNAPLAHCGAGMSLYRLGRYSEALDEFQRAIDLSPDYAEARFSRALVWLALGDFQRGWAEYEWRHQVHHPSRPQELPRAKWDGSPLTGRTLLLHAEQGYGDSVQFSRYAALLAQRGEHILLICPAELKELMTSLRGVEQVIGQGEDLPRFDVQLSLGSMPHVMGTTLETVPAEVPYLFADHGRKQRWRDRLVGLEGRFKVGLAWSGSVGNATNAERSIKLEMLAPLAAVPGVALVSLQKGPAASERGVDLVDYTEDLKDFADTAALIDGLDLVISVETAVAHLAGAMGKPVWTLLAHVADWRWLTERDDSPWYPTMRLYRQPSAGGWAKVIEIVARDLRAMR